MMAQHFSPVETKRLLIRRFCTADVAPFLAYRSDPKVIRFQEWTEVSAEEVHAFVRDLRFSEPGRPGEWFQFAVEHRTDRRLIGDMALGVSVDNPHAAEIGYTLAPTYQRQGYGFEMVSALLDYAFGAFDLHRIFARVLSDNAASINLLERLGFRQEGAFREQYWFAGAWRDELIFAQLRPEWRERRQQADPSPS
jgi:RimJ/RimL family protein N-acetyltransferase